MATTTPSSPPYGAQHRGDAAAYASYFAGMDTTMRQKLAFVGAHFLLDPGARIADMGCGSGAGTYELALINPQIQVIGVDINPDAIRFASEKYELPNLEFVVGDVAEPLFEHAPLDGILSSSTLHHVYTFNGYSLAAVRRALKSHFACLRDGGRFVLRDFVSPPHELCVLLELRDEKSRGESPTELSDADLLVRFARTARPLDARCGPGFFLEELKPRRQGTRLFRLPHKWAAEFVLRKDYRRDWDVELLEEYSYFTAAEFAEELAAAGGRLISAEPYWNPWIVRNRFSGKFRLMSESGADLGWPATNFVAVAQRVPEGSSRRLVERRPSETPPSFLVFETMRHGADPSIVYDLVRRPHPVRDLLPWRLENARIRVIARHGYPRPITTSVPRGPTMIDGARWGGFLIEPLTGSIVRSGTDAEGVASIMTRAGVAQGMIGRIDRGLTYYPSPGGIDETVSSLFVELTTVFPGRTLPPDISEFSTAGSVQEFDAQDLLRAAHVGVLPEARLEMNVYALMMRLGVPAEPYIGEAVETPDAPRPAFVRSTTLAALLSRKPDAPFIESDTSAGYLRLVRSVFADQTDEDGMPRTLAEQELEFVLPRERSVNTVVALPVLCDGEPFVGLETRLLPVPQRHEGNAVILTAPAWRLGFDITSLSQARALLAERFNVTDDDIFPLGAAFFPSAGTTPERVHPFAVRVGEARGELPFDFVPLAELRAAMHGLRDGHLLVAAFRLMHALGLLGAGLK